MKEIIEILDNYFTNVDLKINSLHKDSPFVLSITSDGLYFSRHRRILLKRYANINTYTLYIELLQKPSDFLKNTFEFLKDVWAYKNVNIEDYKKRVIGDIDKTIAFGYLEICMFRLDSFSNVKIEYSSYEDENKVIIKTPVKIIFDNCFSIERRR